MNVAVKNAIKNDSKALIAVETVKTTYRYL